MSDADIVSVFARKMGAVERLVQRTNADVQVPGSGDMKELHTRIADVAAQIKKEKYIEQLEAIEMRARSPLKVPSLYAYIHSVPTKPVCIYSLSTAAAPLTSRYDGVIDTWQFSHESLRPIA
jgi:hypothetical protein